MHILMKFGMFVDTVPHNVYPHNVYLKTPYNTYKQATVAPLMATVLKFLMKTYRCTGYFRDFQPHIQYSYFS